MAGEAKLTAEAQARSSETDVVFPIVAKQLEFWGFLSSGTTTELFSRYRCKGLGDTAFEKRDGQWLPVRAKKNFRDHPYRRHMLLRNTENGKFNPDRLRGKRKFTLEPLEACFTCKFTVLPASHVQTRLTSKDSPVRVVVCALCAGSCPEELEVDGYLLQKSRRNHCYRLQ
jgi:hypothetical protein